LTYAISDPSEKQTCCNVKKGSHKVQDPYGEKR
jgi:hypothetical protein